MRLALAAGKIPYTDNRIPQSKFPEIRPTLPYLSLPTIDIDEATYAQSGCILRYVGRLTGFLPTDPIEALQAEEIVDTLNDLFSTFHSYKGDPSGLTDYRLGLIENQIPRYLGAVDRRMETFGKGPFAVGGKLSIADFSIAAMINSFKAETYAPIDASVADKYPRALQSHEQVMKLPEIIEYHTKFPVV